MFKNTSISQTLVKNTFWLATSITLSKIIRTVVIIFAARLLGTEHYGIFTYAMSLAAIFTIFSDIGLSGLLTKELVKKSERDQEYISTLTVIKLALLTFSALLIVFVGPFIAKFSEAKVLMPVLGALLTFDLLRNFIYSIARSQNKMQIEAGFEFATEVLITVCCLFALFINPTALSLATGYMLGSAIGLCLLLFPLRSYGGVVVRTVNRKLLIPILSTTAPFIVVSIFSVLMTNIDSVFIGIWNTPEVLGLYGAAQRPMSILYLLPGFFSTSLFPVMSSLIKENNFSQASILVAKATKVSVLLVLPIVTGGILVALPLINTVFGHDYIGAVPTFQILLLTLLPIFPGMIFSNILFASGRERVFMKSAGLGALINIVLNIILIPRFGIAGSAVATLCAQITTNGILLFEVQKHYSLPLHKGIWKAFIALILMTIAVFLALTAALPLLVVIPLGAIIYSGTLVLLKESLIQDIKKSFSSR